jgi:hypothetical protein
MEDVSETSRFIERMPEMSRQELAAQWLLEFGSPPHPKLREELMRPVLAYRIQENASGLGKQRIQTRLQNVLAEASTTQFKQGTRIVREWKGQTHEVAVSADGYEYLGETYKSLSPIATKITGTKWSGPAFFGTKPKSRTK